jgi:hypothetical protein
VPALILAFSLLLHAASQAESNSRLVSRLPAPVAAMLTRAMAPVAYAPAAAGTPRAVRPSAPAHVSRAALHLAPRRRPAAPTLLSPRRRLTVAAASPGVKPAAGGSVLPAAVGSAAAQLRTVSALCLGALVPAGDCASFAPDSTYAPEDPLWDIVDPSGAVVASSADTGGWTVNYDPSNGFSVCAPASAPGGDYQVRFRHTSGGTTTSGTTSALPHSAVCTRQPLGQGLRLCLITDNASFI